MAERFVPFSCWAAAARCIGVEFDALWEELFPAEQARIIQLLVERIDVDVDGITIRLRTEGIASAIAELRQRPNLDRAA